MGVSMKKSTYYLFFGLMVLLLMGCSKKDASNGDGVINEYQPGDPLPTTPTQIPVVTSPEVITENHDGQIKSSLSGLWVSDKLSNTRPYAIQFNNFKKVSNQWGLGQAQIVYECIVEGGITRLLGIFDEVKGDRFGSIRSARHYFVSIADEYDAIYIHFGRTKYAVAKMAELGIDHMDGQDGIGSTVFYRDNSMSAPHNAFTSLDRILAGIKKKGFVTTHEADYAPHYSFYDQDTELTSTSSVNKITLDFSNYTSPYFEYNEKDKLYYRFQFGAPHIDFNTKEQLAFKNVIVQFVKEWNIDKNGYQTMDIVDANGSGYYITNGKMVPITWKKKESTRIMRYYNEAGEELTINPGKTFITLFPNDRTEDVILEK